MPELALSWTTALNGASSLWTKADLVLISTGKAFTAPGVGAQAPFADWITVGKGFALAALRRHRPYATSPHDQIAANAALPGATAGRMRDALRATGDYPIGELLVTRHRVVMRSSQGDSKPVIGPRGRGSASGPPRCVFPYPPEPRSAAVARDHVRAQLSAWGLDELADEAAIVASELVTNAIRASDLLARRSAGGDGWPAVALQLTYGHHRLVVEVWDRAAGRPELRRGDRAAGNRRGLHIVNTLATAWGSYPVQADGGPLGKVVWATLSRHQPYRQTAAGDTSTDDDPFPLRSPPASAVDSPPALGRPGPAVLQRVLDRLRALDA